ncbi:uncharacterized protein LOC127841836 [Dreissena polymorpha]|uniref:uncharacterized protein LOC127841836 n=1 Tax=Dreissena polymorpha TaxID=45954 RepID=UPI002264FF85|nr:uncharacterized protein LOC127841836 [Dreissena polymorpha]
MKICKTCGEGSIIEETEDGKTFSVCTDCGTLDNETPELTSEQQFRVILDREDIFNASTTLYSGQGRHLSMPLPHCILDREDIFQCLYHIVFWTVSHYRQN